MVSGGPLVCTITIANAGPSPASGLRLTAPPAAELADPEYTSDYGLTWSPWPGVLDLADPPPGQSLRVFIRGVADGAVSETLTTRASVASDLPDPNPDDNDASEETTILFAPPSGRLTANTAGWPDIEWRMVVFMMLLGGGGDEEASKESDL